MRRQWGQNWQLSVFDQRSLQLSHTWQVQTMVQESVMQVRRLFGFNSSQPWQNRRGRVVRRHPSPPPTTAIQDHRRVGFNSTQPWSFLSHERLACPLLQVGTPRTASTFQWYLLCTIQRACVLLNTKGNNSYLVDCDGRPAHKEAPGKVVLPVKKSHIVPTKPPANARQRIFESCAEGTCSDMAQQHLPQVMLWQSYEHFLRQGLGWMLYSVVQPLFALPETVTREVFAHMKYWSILRQCCGSQQSLGNRFRIHNISEAEQLAAAHKVQAKLDHPLASWRNDTDCNMYQLDVVESLFLNTLLARKFHNRLWLAYNTRKELIRPHICARMEDVMRGGYDFNGIRFPSEKQM